MRWQPDSTMPHGNNKMTKPRFPKPFIILAVMVVSALAISLSSPVAAQVDPAQDAVSFGLRSTNRDAYGVSGWSDELWVLNNDYSDIYRYGLPGGNYRSSFKFKDVNSGNSHGHGMHIDGGRMWIADRTDDKLYGYRIGSGGAVADDNDADIDLNSGNNDPRGVAGHGGTVWVLDKDKRVYAYGASSGSYLSNRSFGLESGNDDAHGIWTDGQTMWVNDGDDRLVRAYSLTTSGSASRAPDQDVNLNPGNEYPRGMWSNGEVLWVADGDDDKMYAYQMPASAATVKVSFEQASYEVSEGAAGVEVAVVLDAAPGREVTVPVSVTYRGGATPSDLSGVPASVVFGADETRKTFTVNAQDDDIDETTEGVTLRLVEPAGVLRGAIAEAAVDIEDNDRSDAVSFGLRSTNRDAYGVSGWGDELWVLNNDYSDIYRYGLPGGNYRSFFKFKDVNGGNSHGHGMHIDGGRMWIADRTDDKLYGYRIGSGGAVADDNDADIDLNSGNNDPRGVAGHGGTVWVLDKDKSVYAYGASSGSYLSNRSFGLESGNDDAHGIWTDGQTMWVNDGDDRLVRAYSLTTSGSASRAPDQDVNLNPGNEYPRGMWSNGEVLWVTDGDDDKMYAYQLSIENYAPRFLDGDTAQSRAVSATAAEGIPVGDPLLASDHENDQLIYGLETNNTHFTVDSNTGQIRVSPSAVLTEDITHSIRLTVHDGKNAAFGADTTIDDTIDVNITVYSSIYSFANQFNPEAQGVLTDDAHTNNWRYMWRHSANYDDVTSRRACGASGSSRPCQDMPVLTTPPVRALRWLDLTDRGWFNGNVGIDLKRQWHPTVTKRVVLGWTSTLNRSVTADILGGVRMSAAGSDVKAAVYSGDHALISWIDVSSGSYQTMNFDGALIHPGDELFFIVEAREDHIGDYLNWDPIIAVTATHATSIHDSSIEYRSEQANLVNDVHSDDWLYEYKYSITDTTPANRSDSDNEGSGTDHLPVNWLPDNTGIFRLETHWDDPTYTKPGKGNDRSGIESFGDRIADAFSSHAVLNGGGALGNSRNIHANDIHSHDINSRLWGIGMWSRAWTGIGHNLHVGPDWMQPVHGMDAVKTWVHTYPSPKDVRLQGSVSLRSGTSVSGQGNVRLLILTTDSENGQGTIRWDVTLSSSESSKTYDVSIRSEPRDRIHFLAHQMNTHQSGTWDGREHSDAHAVNWTPAVEVTHSSDDNPRSEIIEESEIIYPPEVIADNTSYRVLVDNGEPLSNPGMGIQHAIYDNFLQHYGGGTPPSDTLDWFEGLTSVYVRIPWSFVQQEDDVYVWSRIDEILDYWGMKGKRAGFRFSTLESEHQATPVYLKNVIGAGGSINGERQFFGRVWTAFVGSNGFINEYRQLLEAFATRYNGDPRVDYVEMGALGRWGEGHTVHNPTASQAREWATMFRDVFDDTHIRVLWPDDIGKSDSAIANIGPDLGFGLYDDSTSFATRGLKQAEQVWRKQVVRLEYGQLFERDWWIHENPSRMLRSLEAYHASYYYPHGYPDRYWAWFSDLARAAARRIGYRFNFTDAHWQRSVAPGQIATFDLSLRNSGVAPNYDGGRVGIVLTNGDTTATTIYSGFDVSDLPVASTQTDKVGYSAAEVVRLQIPMQIPPDFPAGRADVSVFIRQPQDYGIRSQESPNAVVGNWQDRPWEYYELPLANRIEHQDRAFSYVIGQIEVDVASNLGSPIESDLVPARSHSYLEEFANPTDLSDSSHNNDWTVYWSRAASNTVTFTATGVYIPLAGSSTQLQYQSQTPSNGWRVDSSTSYPMIGGSEGLDYVHPSAVNDAVIRWDNTTGAEIQALVAGTVTKVDSRGDGVRLSLVQTNAMDQSSNVLWGPITVTQSGPVSFSLKRVLNADDQVNLVVNANQEDSYDEVSIEDFRVVDVDVKAVHFAPAATNFDVSYTARLNDSDWLYRWVAVRGGGYQPMNGELHDMTWKYNVGWVPDSEERPRIGLGSIGDSLDLGAHYHTTNVIEPDQNQDAVLTWKSTRRATTPVVVKGTFFRTDGTCGDGTRISIVKGTGAVLWSGFTKGQQLRLRVATTVNLGDEINLVVNVGPGGGDNCDAIRADYTIETYDGLHDYTHVYDDEGSSVSQGVVSNENHRDDWLYRWSPVPNGEYVPSTQSVSNLLYKSDQNGNHGWGVEGQNDLGSPMIGDAGRQNAFGPSPTRDAILTWVNTRDVEDSLLGSVITVSGAVELDKSTCQDNYGIRFSIVRNLDEVLAGPITVRDPGLIPFNIITAISKNDQINLIMNSEAQNQACSDGAILHGLVIHRYPTKDGPRRKSLVNKEPGVAVSPPSIVVDAGQTATYAVSLNTDPDSSVSVFVSSSDTSVVAPNISVLEFDSSNWSMRQSVSLTAPPDADLTAETATIVHRVVGYGSVVSARPLRVQVLRSQRSGAVSFGLRSTNRDAYGVSGWGDELWVLNNDYSDIYRYGLPGGNYRSSFKFKDVNSGNSHGHGMHIDGGRMWIADQTDDKLYGYRIGSGGAVADDTDADIDLNSGNDDSRGVAGHGGTVWVLDEDKRVYAYGASSGSYLSNRSFGLESGNDDAHGIWTDGQTMWVNDGDDRLVRAYSLTTSGSASRAPDQDVSLDPGNEYPRGMWSNGEVLWVADGDDDKMYAYHMPASAATVKVSFEQASYEVSEGAAGVEVAVVLDAAPGREVTVPVSVTYRGGATPSDLSGVPASVVFGADETRKTFTVNAQDDDIDETTEGVTLRLVEPAGVLRGAIAEAAVDIEDNDRSDAVSFGLRSTNRDAYGVSGWSDELWVLNNDYSDIYRYGLPGGNYRSFFKFKDVNGGNSHGHGMHIDGGRMWIADQTDDKLYGYRIGSGGAVADDNDADIDLNSGNDDSRGVAGHGGTVWVLDEDKRVYAYGASSGSYLSNRSFGLESGNDDAHGIWTDGQTMWVNDGDDRLVRAYSLTTSGSASRAPDQDVNLNPGNDHPRGMWSNGEVLWVADGDDDKMYAYHMPASAATVKVSFEQASYEVSEGAAGVEVAVVLDAAPGREVTVPVSVTYRGGATPSDLSGVPASVVFGADETRKTFTVNAQDDDIYDDGEVVVLRFAAPLPERVVAGTVVAAAVAIVDRPEVTVSFEQESYDVSEGVGVLVKVSLSGDPHRRVEVPLRVEFRGGADSSDLYELPPESVVFEAGQTIQRLFLEAVLDTADEGENVVVSFGEPPEGVSLGEYAEAVVSILGPPVTVSFEQESYDVSEGVGVLVKVSLSGDPQRRVEVPLRVEFRGGADSSDLYELPPESVVFEAGQTIQWLFLEAVLDTADEGENVVVSFGEPPEGVSLGEYAEAVVSILGPPVTVSFEQESYDVSEGAGVLVKVSLSGDPQRRVEVPLRVEFRGGADSSDLYELPPESVVFEAGQTIQWLFLEAVLDTADEGENVVVGFGLLPKSVAAGTTAETVLEIIEAEVGFAALAYSVDEGSEVAVEVTLSRALSRVVTVPVVAVENSERIPRNLYFDGVPDSVVFAPGETSKSFTFRPHRDGYDIDEGWSMTFSLAESESLPSGVGLGTVREAVVTVADIDSPFAPQVGDDAAMADTGATVVVGVLANDVGAGFDDIDPATLTIERDPLLGTATVAHSAALGYHIVYAANNTAGSDTFRYRVCDSAGACSEAEVSVMVGTSGCTMLGTEGDDVIQGTEGDDVICALGGNDTVHGHGGDDVIYGGAGDDTIYSNGVSTVYAGAGDDAVHISSTTWREDRAEVYGGVGDDMIIHSGHSYGVIKIYGGAGDDTLNGDGNHYLAEAASYRIYGGYGDDTIYGGPYSDRLYGGPGDDELHGRLGSDMLNGGQGDDHLFGGGDEQYSGDTLLGGDGNDTLWGDYVGNDPNRADEEDDNYGTGLFLPSNDYLFGGSGNDMLNGGQGNDYLFGGSGNDMLDGGAGNDYAKGGQGTDFCTTSETAQYCGLLPSAVLWVAAKQPHAKWHGVWIRQAWRITGSSDIRGE